jgi:hypothetical protein
MSFARPYIFQPATTVDLRNGDDNLKNTIKSIGGQDAVNFIQTNIKKRSVFLVPGGLVYTFPTVLDHYMVDYPRSKVLLKAQEIYSPKKQIALGEALNRLKQGKAQYVLLNDAPDENEAFFNANPKNFQKLYNEKGVSIYKVNY